MAFFDKIKNLFNKNDKLSSEESSLKQKKLEEALKVPVSIPLSEGVDKIVKLIKKEYIVE